MLKEHTDREEKRFEGIEEGIHDIKENHLKHIELDMQSLKMQGIELRTNLSWVKWGVLLVLGTLVSGSLSLIFILK